MGSVAKLLSQGFQNSGEAPSRFQCLRRGRTGRRVIHAIYQAAEYHGIAVTSYYYCVHIGGPGVPSVLLAFIQSYVMKCIFTRTCMYVFTDICSICIVILMIRFVCIYTCIYLHVIIEGSLVVKLPTIWTDEKQRWEESEKRREEERRSKKRKSPNKEDPGARKGRKVARHSVFPMICGSGGSKSRLAKGAGAGPAGQMRDEKLPAVVARSTLPSQNVQSTSASEGFLKLRCQKSARRCGAKHISKSKVQRTDLFRALLEVEMSKKCTPLWREAHFEVKSVKN